MDIILHPSSSSLSASSADYNNSDDDENNIIISFNLSARDWRQEMSWCFFLHLEYFGSYWDLDYCFYHPITPTFLNDTQETHVRPWIHILNKKSLWLIYGSFISIILLINIC